MTKFGNSAGTLIKNFVNDNIDFFREDYVIIEWLHVLEMAVKFESEENEMQPRRGPHRKPITTQRSDSQSPEKKSSRQSAVDENEPKAPGSKFREMSKYINSKLDRRKRKYKKKQVEYIAWHYEDINDARIRDLIDVMSVLINNEENKQFYEYLYNTAFMQTGDLEQDQDNVKLVESEVVPTLLSKGRPILLNQAVK